MTREEAIWYLTPIAESASLERYKEALSMAIADIREQEERRWIPMTERLPEANQRVIVCRKDGRVEQGFYLSVNGWWKVYGTNTKSITHWMPMPEPPKENDYDYL